MPEIPSDLVLPTGLSGTAIGLLAMYYLLTGRLATASTVKELLAAKDQVIEAKTKELDDWKATAATAQDQLGRLIESSKVTVNAMDALREAAKK